MFTATSGEKSPSSFEGMSYDTQIPGAMQTKKDRPV
jgi:hypothetical protein